MRLLILFAAISAVLLVAGCNAFDQSTTSTCDKKLQVRERDECVYNQSTKKLSSVMCADIVNITLKVKCIDDIGVALLDYLPCKQQDTAKLKDQCEAKVSEARKRVREQNPNARLP